MGLAASNLRLLNLTQRKSDLEYRIQMACQRRISLAYQTASLFEKYFDNKDITGIDPKNTKTSQAQLLAYYKKTAERDSKSAALQSQDKMWELEQKNLETQHKAVTTELESVKKVLDKNIESSFKTFA